MLITARESSQILAQAGVSRQQSRRALLAGLAGEAMTAGSQLLYDADRVQALSAWPAVDQDRILESCPAGVLVVRLGPGEEPEPGWSWAQRAQACRRQPYLGFAAWVHVCALTSTHGRLGCVVTVCGYPVLLADLTTFRAVEAGEVELGLEPPGAWASVLDQGRLLTGPGPRWLVLGAQPYAGRAARARERGEAVNAGRATIWERWG